MRRRSGRSSRWPQLIAVVGLAGVVASGWGAPAFDRAVAGGHAIAAVDEELLTVPQSPEIDPDAPIAIVGIPGLRWSDLLPGDPVAPRLAALAQDADLGSIVVRTGEAAACPLDGWLTLNSGARSVGPRPGGACAPVPDPVVEDGATRVPDWDALLAPNADYPYDPVWGTLAGRGTAAEQACAIGPGAAVALADAQGRVRARYGEKPADLPDPARCDLLVVDALGSADGPDVLPTGGAARAAALREADTVLAALEPDRLPGRTIVVGIADSTLDEPHLGAVLSQAGPPGSAGRDPSDAARGLLAAASTRQPGLVQLTDLTPTALRDAAPADLVGTALTTHPPGDVTAAAAIERLHHLDVAAQVMRTQFVPFFIALIAGQLLLYGLTALALRLGRLGRAGAARAVRVVGLGFGAAPVASVLANLVAWPAAGRPALALWGLLVGISAAIAAAALAGPWRRHPYGSAGFVAAVTVTVFGADVVTGSNLQLTALFGLSPLIGGRFYGFGNIAFAVFAMAALVAAAWAGTAPGQRIATLVQGDRSRAAGLVAAGLGAGCVALTGWPNAGADFGGVLALVPGVAVLACGLAGVRLTLARLAALAALSVAAVTAIAVADWTRPAAARSHLGRFVQDVLDGRAGEVIARKAGANLGLLVDAPVIVAAALPLLALVLIGLARPDLLRLHGLERAQQADPALRTLLLACLTTALVGFAVNDSGVIVPATALVAAGPLVAAIWAGIWPPVSPGATAGSAAPPAPEPHGRTGAAGAPGRASPRR